MGNRPDSLS